MKHLQETEQKKQKVIWGIIYRAYIPGRLENGIEPCYIGKTIQPLADRENQHWRAAKESADEKRGAGKLHKIMHAEGRHRGRVLFEEIAQAFSMQELAKKERFYVLKYKSAEEPGWNSNVPTGKPLATSELSKISVMGHEIYFNGFKDLSRKLSQALEVKVSYSTLRRYLQDAIDPNDPEELETACKSSIDSAAQTASQERERIIFGTVVSGKKWFSQIVNNRTLNRNGLTKAQLRSLLGGKDDKASIEDALRQKPKRTKKSLKITTDGKKYGPYPTIRAALSDLKKAFPKKIFPAESTVSANLGKGYSDTQAFGLEEPPWATTPLWLICDQLIRDGYDLIGEKRHESEPIISNHWRIVFASRKACADHFFIDYTTLCEKLKEMDLDDYLETKGKIRVQ